jgi:acetyltransferase-like isoleucine patch superfamily enzyme
MNTIKNILRPFVHFLRVIGRLNWFKTLYLNFKTQPFNVAIQFPFFVYGKLDIHSLIGEILIDAPIKRGMIKIGFRELDLLPVSYLPNQILNTGKLIFHGPVIISGGVSLSIDGGCLEIGSCCTIGGGCLLKSTNSITIGSNTRITYSCIVFDSNVHYVKNIETGVIKRNNGPIVIGKNCWINGGAYIGKDAVVPDYSIIARNSLVNKDFTGEGTNLFLVGNPAKALTTKVQRILSLKEEWRLTTYFEQNSDEKEFIASPGLFDDFNDTFNDYLKK